VNNKEFQLQEQYSLFAEIADTVIRVKNGKIESVTPNENPKKIDEVKW
jgi:putative ABC transport system ATP-binding protein